MRSFELIERLMQSEQTEVCVLNSAQDPVAPQVTELNARLVLLPSVGSTNNSLTLNDYQDYSAAEAVYQQHGQGAAIGVSIALTGLVGETGRALHTWHDVMRNGLPLSEDIREQLRAMLAHSLWYSAALASELGMTMNELGIQSIRQARAWRREHDLAARQTELQPRTGRMAAAGDADAR